METPSSSKLTKSPPKASGATEADKETEASGSNNKDLKDAFHEVLHKDMRTELFRSISTQDTELEPHDFTKDLSVQVLFRNNTRRDYILNKFQVILKEDPESDRYLKMEEELNRIYSEVRKHRLSELNFQPSANLPGRYVVVFDAYKDHIGRFKRGKIMEFEGVPKDTIMCHLIDEGTTRPFHMDQLYKILNTFLQTPPKTLTVQLSELKPLVGSPAFGRILEATLGRLAFHTLVLVLFLGENLEASIHEPFQVQLFSVDMKAPINQMVATEFASDYGQQFRHNNLERPLQGDVFRKGRISHFTKDGRVWIQFRSRTQQLIRSHLDVVFGNWTSYSLFRYQNQDWKTLHGQICVGIHPQREKLLRCELLSRSVSSGKDIGKEDSKMALVRWVDYGDECLIKLADLLPNHFLSKVLTQTKPIAKEFQLVNIQSLKPNYLQSLMTSRAEVTVRVIETPSGLSDPLTGSSGIPVVQLVKKEVKQHEGGFRISKICINDKMLKNGWAKPTVHYSVFSPRKSIQPNGLCKLSMEYTSAEWIYDSPAEDQVLRRGAEITFYASKIIGDMFVIHPWASKYAFEDCQAKLLNYFEEVSWVREEREASKYRSPPSGQFCAYKSSSDGDWHRVRILRKVHKEASMFPTANSDKYLENTLIELLLIDQAQFTTAEYQNLWRLFPFQSVSSLGPQGALARLKVEDKDCGLIRREIPLAKNGEMNKRLVELLKEGFGRRASAILEDIETDSNGRALMTLDQVQLCCPLASV